MAEEERFISIRTLTNRFEGDLLLEALLREEVPTILRSFEETPYDGLFIPQRGWGLLLVPESQASRARQIIQPLLEHIESGQPYPTPAEIDPLLWEDLRKADPESVCHNAEVYHDPRRGAYIVPLLNREFACFPLEERIEPLEHPLCNLPSFESDFVLLHYLLEAQPVAPAGSWIRVREIPGGELFFQGRHQFPPKPFLDLLGSEGELFRKASRRLDGSPLPMGDVAFRYRVLPRIPLVFVLWEGHDAFEPILQVRFDASVVHHFKSLQVLWTMVNVVCECLRTIAEELSETME
ncbi:MAG: DUF3786 domain-containing protein [Syntrophobacteraceae bacterium]|nr:DUF3786 domain-containing protein [Syntrophobacteraceae bacterium]